ncbi:MAG: helix-turn-helix domain-containing protein [Rubrivivax sp.]|nr:helix-turn-helix domain-containing protein [Rubrivivax sp.]
MPAPATSKPARRPAPAAAHRRAVAEVQGDTPALRLLALLEHIAGREGPHSLQALADATALPKATVHRMLQQLEGAGLLQREGDGRQYGAGARLRRLAESVLLNSGLHGARHQVLRALVDELGESCNLTTLAGGEVLYVDRVETAAPLRFYLQPGSRVPVHCSASGKLFLAQMPETERQRLLAATPLQAFTPATLTKPAALQAELERIAREGHALDREEFLPGLVCVAVPVPAAQGERAALCLAVQAPAMRMPADRAAQVLPALRRAALQLAALDGAAAVPRRTASTPAPKSPARKPPAGRPPAGRPPARKPTPRNPPARRTPR